MADRVEFHLFGRPCALVGGRPIPLTSKVAQILAVLALDDRRAMARGDLAALLWDGAPDSSGNLRQLLHRLHRDWPDLAAALGADARTLRLTEGTTGFYLDLDAFARLCRSSDDAGDALLLLRGPLLEGIEGCGEPFEDWLRDARTRFDLLAEALTESLLLDPARASPETLVLTVDRIVASEPTPGRRHQIIEAFARQNRPNVARRNSATRAPNVPIASAKDLEVETSRGLAASRGLRVAFHDLDFHAAPDFEISLRIFFEDCADHLAGFRSFVTIAPQSTMRPNPPPSDLAVTSRLRFGRYGPVLVLRLLKEGSDAIIWTGRFDVSASVLADSAARLARRVAGQVAAAVEACITEHIQVASWPDASAKILWGHEVMGTCNLPGPCRAARDL